MAAPDGHQCVRCGERYGLRLAIAVWFSACSGVELACCLALVLRGAAVISIRSFRNDDLRAITQIWNHQSRSRGRFQPMTRQVFEREVLSKPYFDRHSLIVAVADEIAVGFVHAAFAGDVNGRRLSNDLGIICALQVLPRPDRDQIGAQLLRCAEEGLISSGAANLQGGCMRNAAPWLVRAGYKIRDERLIYQRSVDSFRPAAQRALLQVRRRHVVDVEGDLPAPSWWEACQRGNAHVSRLRLSPRDAPTQEVTALSIWEPTGLQVQRTVAIVDWDCGRAGIDASVAEFLVGEAVLRCGQQGASTIEIQITAGDRRGQDLVECLGFDVVERGLCLVRDTHL